MGFGVRDAVMLALAGLVGGGAVLLAGPLDPPSGPVSSTYKTLTEVEPRVAINATNTPGDANALYRITQPGSYYLTGNITGVSGKSGIEIATSNGVTIDLRGFTLQGVSGSLDGIVADGSQSLIAIHNGKIGGWSRAINLLLGEGYVLQDLVATGNIAGGIAAGTGTVIRNCELLNTLGSSPAMLVGADSIVDGCSARGNNGVGISAGFGSVLSRCVATENAGVGIVVQGGRSVTDCAALSNQGDGIQAAEGSTIDSCSSFGNTGDGFDVTTGVQVCDCVARQNGGHGVRAWQHCTVSGSICSDNGTTSGSGVLVHGTGNRIERCNVVGNDRGFEVTGTDNVIVQNSARNNTQGNYSIAAGNDYGQILTNPGTGFVATNPWANFAY